MRLVLADLNKTAADLRTLTTRALDQLCGSLMPRLRPALDAAAAASYELGDDDLGPPTGGGGGPSAWPQDLLLAFSGQLGWLQPLLTRANWDALVHLALDKAGPGGAVSVCARQGCPVQGVPSRAQPCSYALF